MVVGESIAEHAGDEGFPKLLTTPGLVVYNLGTIGCRLIPEATRLQVPNGPVVALNGPPCQDIWAAGIARWRPDVVVMLRASPGSAVVQINGQWTAPCKPLYDNVLELSLHAQIRMLSSLGAHVIVATAAYALLPFLQPAWYLHDDCHNAIFRRVVASEPHAVLADVFSWLCPHLDKPCMRTAGALIVLRPDGLHFLGASARLLAAWMIRQAQRHGVLTNVRVQGPEPLELTLPLLP